MIGEQVAELADRAGQRAARYQRGELTRRAQQSQRMPAGRPVDDHRVVGGAAAETSRDGPMREMLEDHELADTGRRGGDRLERRAGEEPA